MFDFLAGDIKYTLHAIMAWRWNCDILEAEYRDPQATAMAVDRTGHWAVLAGRKALVILDLDQPRTALKRFQRQSKWEAGPSEWHPMHNKQNMFALTFNDKLELFQYHNGDIISDIVVKAHTRTISDLDWSPFDANLLATCSIDSFACIWDIRDMRRPANHFHCVAGVTQVKWNKFKENLIASSHEGDVRLWDPRKCATPIQYITCHLSKINGLDWSPIHDQQSCLVTCSQDCTVKFWDVANTSRATTVVSCNHPVWRARFTPFGDGLLTVVVPQVRRGESCVLLWNTAALRSPVHSFVGPDDIVREFYWRQKDDDYQLVTWARDHCLTIWRIDAQLQKLCGRGDQNDLDLIAASAFDSMGMDATSVRAAKNGTQAMDSNSRNELFDHLSAPLLFMDDEDELKFNAAYESEITDDVENGKPKDEISTSQPKNLQQEFHLLNRNIPNVHVEEMNIKERTCIVSASSGKYKVRLLLRFPDSYPFNSPPSIQFYKGSAISSHIKTELTKVLRKTCQQHVKKNLSCLEPCLRQLISTLMTFEKDSVEVGSPYTLDALPTFVSPKMYGSHKDANIPFPRTSGASFCSSGFLVFYKSPSMKGLPNDIRATPRSLLEMIAYEDNPMQPGSTTPSFNLMYPPVAQSPTGDPDVSISSFYYQDRKQRARGKLGKEARQKKSCPIVIYDISKCCPVNRDLAVAYILDDHDILSTCTKNMAVAAALGRKDLAQLWSLASLSASPILVPNTDPNLGIPWPFHPFGRKMFECLIQHYLNIGDIQTVAMLVCTFTPRPFSQPAPKKPRLIPDTVISTPGGSPYHTIHPGDTIEGSSLGALLKSNRSNSWSDYLDDYGGRHFHSVTPVDSRDVERERHENNSRILDPNQNLRYDEFKRAYAEILYQWKLLEPRAQILKRVSTPAESHRGIEFLNECRHCRRDIRGRQCVHCKSYSLSCIICHIAVKGLFSFCMLCGHGGHSYHLIKWFLSESICPTGCGCECLLADISEEEG